jgi:hypothetical protein
MAQVTDEFGCGLVFPFQRDGQGDFRSATGLPLLGNDIEHLLGIQGPTADSPGELPWDGDVGSRLPNLKHRFAFSEVIDAEAQMMTSEVVRRFERRVRVGRTRVRAVEAPTGVQRSVEVAWSPVGRRSGSVERSVIPLKGGA